MPEEVFAIVITVIGIGGALALAGMIVHAVNRHLDRKARAAVAPEAVADLRAEVGALREQVVQLEERMDFTERLLAQSRGPERLRGGT